MEGSFLFISKHQLYIASVIDAEIMTCDDNTCTTLKVYMLRQKPHLFVMRSLSCPIVRDKFFLKSRITLLAVEWIQYLTMLQPAVWAVGAARYIC